MPKNDKCKLHNRGMFGKDVVVDPTSHKKIHGISDTCANQNSVGQ